MDDIDFNKTALKTFSPKVEFDPDEYLHYLDGMELTDAEAKEVLSVLWDMMVQFVDLGFGVDFNTGRASQKPMLDAAMTDSKSNETSKTTDLGGNTR